MDSGCCELAALIVVGLSDEERLGILSEESLEESKLAWTLAAVG